MCGWGGRPRDSDVVRSGGVRDGQGEAGTQRCKCTSHDIRVDTSYTTTGRSYRVIHFI